MQILCSSSNWAPEWERGDSSDCESDRLWLQSLLNCWDFPTRPSLCLKKRKYPVSASTRRQSQTEAGSNNSNKHLLESMYANEHKVDLKLLSVTMHCSLKGLHSHQFQTTRASLGCGGNGRFASWTWSWINLQQRRTKISDLCFQHPVGTKN